jgi:formate hydrogenlyase subunit 3/multisubunit Na+/H+ antiporter MnhD subunit
MTLLLWGLACCALAAAAASLPSTYRLGVTTTLGAVGCALALGASLDTLLRGSVATVHTARLLPMFGLTLSLDPLGALFVLAAAFVGFACCIYCVGYARDEMRSRSALALLMTFIFALLAVPIAASIVSFLFSWELMAVSSMLLILTDQRHSRDARSASLWYGVMTQLGAASILLGFLLLTTHGGGQSFADLRHHASMLSPTLRSFAFALTLLGFASKAGAVPLHVWLPKAHPEAPSPVSALMSSAMVALGVYGIIRVGVDLLGGGTVWWWVAVASFGAVSALYGALHATTATDVKRLLAYSTIDILGLVLVGVGAAGALVDTGHLGVGELALTAALLLVLAHAGFKGALFLAAGSVERSTGTRNLDRLGGLIHTMPFTAGMFALGACSIMAVPTLSGFSSEWLLLQGLLHGFRDQSTPTLIVMLAGVVALALTGGLTAVAFVKAFGIGFLGQARSRGALDSFDAPPTMKVAMAILVVPSFVIGLVPGLVVPLVERAARVGQAPIPSSPVLHGIGLGLSHFRGAIEPTVLLVAFVVVILLLLAFSRGLANRKARRVDAWGCGRDVQTSRMQYTATSFAEPLQRVFSDVLRPQTDVEVTHVAESRYYEQSLRYRNRVSDALEQHGYRPLIDATLSIGRAARRLQNGSVHRYLAFGFVALLVVLVVLA